MTFSSIRKKQKGEVMIFESKQVKELREKMGLTQEAFARKIDVGVRTIARWEENKLTKIHLRTRKKLARLYKQHMED
jgi:DNA-binding transcriptional regulator YiaG